MAILIRLGSKKCDKRPRNGRDTQRSVWDDLADSSFLELNQSVRKGQNQIGLEILSYKDQKSLKIGPEMAEKSQGQFGTPSLLRVTYE